jgi:DNA-binding transcriptional ArsR family regulator
LANATRRHILQVVQARGSMTAGEIASRFEHSWPTTSGHLRQLQVAGLLLVERVGRERQYSVDVERLFDVPGRWFAAFS